MKPIAAQREADLRALLTKLSPNAHQLDAWQELSGRWFASASWETSDKAWSRVVVSGMVTRTAAELALKGALEAALGGVA